MTATTTRATNMAKQQTATQTKAPAGAHGRTGSAGQAVERPLLRTIRGIVASDKGDKTIKVVVAYQTRHEKYGKYLKRRTVLHAHDEKNDAKEGDTVEIAECRPISRTKHHRLLRVVERAPELSLIHISEPTR